MKNDRALLEDALELLEEWQNGKTPYEETKKLIGILTERFTPVKPRLDDTLTPKYEKAKELRATGLMLKDACAQAGITPDQWYRRKRMEETGVDRINREYYLCTKPNP